VPTPEQLARGIAFYDRACSLRHPNACRNLALHRAREAANSGDSAASQLADLRQDCLDGAGAACFSLASLYDVHLGAELHEDPAAANEALLLGCERMDYDSCQNLAWHYDHAFGVERDQVRSAALYQLACNDNAGYDCMFVPRSAYQSPLYRGDEVLDDWRMAAGAYVRACDQGLAMGCFGMARLIAKSGNGVQHGDKMRDYLEQALAITPGLPIAVELMRRLDAGELPPEPIR
jgi:TPR repeat protein